MADEQSAKLAIINGLAGNYSATLSPETSKMWLFLLRDYNVQEVQAAALNVIKHCDDVPYKAMPPFAKMQKELDALDGTVRGEAGIRLQAEAEWCKVMDGFTGYGVYSEPDFCPITERVIRMMGGWRVACSWLEKDLNWRHQEFIDLWEQVQGKEEFIALGADAVRAIALPGPMQRKKKRLPEGPQLLGDIMRDVLTEDENAEAANA